MLLARRILPLTFLALAACSGNEASNTLGLTKRAPDEFVVYSRPPLVVPPEFELMPPTPGAESPHAVSTEQQARQLLLGTSKSGSDGMMSYDEFMQTPADAPAVDTAVTPVISADTPTAASSNFLSKIGADSAAPDIRKQLATDATVVPENAEAGSLYEEIVGAEQRDTLVDPAAEAERLRANKDEGKAVTEGETPTIDPTPKSVLDRVF